MGANFDFSAAVEACNAAWNLGANWAFARTEKSTEILSRIAAVCNLQYLERYG